MAKAGRNEGYISYEKNISAKQAQKSQNTRIFEKNVNKTGKKTDKQAKSKGQSPIVCCIKTLFSDNQLKKEVSIA